MKVVVLGGYGLFGGRLARLLLRDGHDVWVAGRDDRKAHDFCATHGGRPLRLDRNGDLSGLHDLGVDAVVDAVGPFQEYGDEGRRLAAFCVVGGINYLDLSDDAAFTAGITALDAAAKAAGVFVLSGVSSVPALSAAAVRALASDLDGIDAIETAILPGNRVPPGRSVIAGILTQVGAPLRIWRGGLWRQVPCWSDPRTYRLENGSQRQARLIGVPDLALFPEHFGARSVTFRAGLELGIMNVALAVYARARRWFVFRPNRAFHGLVHKVSSLLQRFGTDTGGMVVIVKGGQGGSPVWRRWVLTAAAGDGPFIPAIAARALFRRPGTVAPGARPCLADLSLAELEAAMADLAVETRRTEGMDRPLFHAALNDGWDALPDAVRRLHGVPDVEEFVGRAEVTRGSGLVARALAVLFRFPKAGSDVPVAVTKTRIATGEIWERDFAGRRFRSVLSPSDRPGRVREAFGPFVFELALAVRDGVHHLPVSRGWFLGVPIPAFLLPASDTCEFEQGGRFSFDVRLTAPLGRGLIVHYRGWLESAVVDALPQAACAVRVRT